MRVYRSILSTINSIVINDVLLCEFIVQSQVPIWRRVIEFKIEKKKIKPSREGFFRSLAIDPSISPDRRKDKTRRYRKRRLDLLTKTLQLVVGGSRIRWTSLLYLASWNPIIKRLCRRTIVIIYYAIPPSRFTYSQKEEEIRSFNCVIPATLSAQVF